jgi:hypothetical protein
MILPRDPHNGSWAVFFVGLNMISQVGVLSIDTRTPTWFCDMRFILHGSMDDNKLVSLAWELAAELDEMLIDKTKN